jgi:hypothetical protein
MQQLDYWFDKYPDGFYKFMQPCSSHKAYREGDSWSEELALSSDEFRTAFDAIGKRHTSKTAWKGASDPFDGLYYCSYHDKKEGVTWYFRNHELVDSALDALHIANPSERPKTKPFPVNGQPQSTEMSNPNLQRLAIPIYRDGQPQSSFITEITPEITPENLYKERAEEKEEEEPRPKASEPTADIPISATTKHEPACQPEDLSEDNRSAAAVAVRNYNPADPFFKRYPKPNEHYQGVPPLEKWEVSSGKPYPYFWQWREAFYRNQGGSISETAKSNAYSEFYKNRLKTNVLWQEFLDFYKIALDNALQIQASGMTPTLPSCFSNDAPVTEEQVAKRLDALGNNLLVALPQAAPTPSCNQSKPWQPDNAIAPSKKTPVLPAPKPTPPQTTKVEASPCNEIEAAREELFPRQSHHFTADSLPPVSEPPEFIKNIVQKMVMPKAERNPVAEYTNLVKKYRSWLKSGIPALRNEAMAVIMKRPDLDPIYDEEGSIIDVEEIEF